MSVKPMLASLGDESFDSDEWIFEIKWDGYRAVAGMKDKEVVLQSRNNLSFLKKFYPIGNALKEWEVNAIVDGEIVAVNDEGHTNFQDLQAWQKTGKGELVYYLFDILWLDGYSLMHLPLIERKSILQGIVPTNSAVKYSDHILSKGKDFFELAVTKGLEGIMAKRADSMYTPAMRTQQWLKIKTHRRQEVVVAGFTKGRNSRQYFGALILGVYENEQLVYVGHTGSGFNQKTLAEMYEKLEPLVTDKCPFARKPKTNMPAIWVKPKLVVEVKFQEWTNENILRIPIYIGLREDKSARDVKKEVTHTMAKPVTLKSTTVGQKKSAPEQKKVGQLKVEPKPRTKSEQKDLVTDSDKESFVTVDKKELKFTNLPKLYWKKEKITKGDTINYYHKIASFILPYMKDRPQSLNRTPDGAGGMNFYQKDVTGKVPAWVKTHKYRSESDGELKKFLVCTDEASLLYMVNWGCIEMNPWHSRTSTPEKPDYCVIDLDPEKISFDKVIETANVIKRVLDDLAVESFCKTSGSSGLHIYIPLAAKYSYDQSRQLAELIVQLVHEEIPGITSLERSPAKRQRKVYLDYLQNRTIQTLAAPYSLRPKPGATVSTPLHWDEVRKGLTIADFTIKNIFDRIKVEGDLFQGVLKGGINLHKVLEKLTGMISEKH